MRSKWLAALLLVIFGSMPVYGHHSFAAEFDENKPVKFTGELTKIAWSNPHGWIYVDVQEDGGGIVNWACETQGRNALFRQGWTQEDLPIGTIVTILGYRARNGSPTVNTYSVTLPNGKVLSTFTGSRPGLDNAVSVGNAPSSR